VKTGHRKVSLNKSEQRGCEKVTGACGCEKFPLRKGGSAVGAGVVLQGREVMGKGRRYLKNDHALT